MLCKNKQIEDDDALIYGFPVPYSAKHCGGERFNTNARYDWTGEIGVDTYTTCEYILCKLVPTSMFASLVRNLSYWQDSIRETPSGV